MISCIVQGEIRSGGSREDPDASMEAARKAVSRIKRGKAAGIDVIKT